MMLNRAVLIAAYIALCILMAYLGRRRKWGFWGYLWSSVLFTPVLGMLFVLAADPPPKRRDATDGVKGLAE
jgi:hypothetical protein